MGQRLLYPPQLAGRISNGHERTLYVPRIRVMLPRSVPDKPTLDGLEERWSAVWEEQGTYRFDRSKTREQVYSIDTPPPTVSGSLHVGHVFSYTHTDVIARYQRMRGKEVFYPIGWDDNGLATERRVQNFFGVRCDPSVAFDPDFTPPQTPGKAEIPISRQNFVSLCERLTEEDEKVFEAVVRRVGLSVDWTTKYTTISDDTQAVSQRAFLHNLARGEAYQSEAPTLWDVTFRTAVAQAELEDRERPGAYHRVRFAGSEPVFIETTRPELIPACVALVAHPRDSRYQPLFGTTVRTPVFGVEVPVLAHHLAEPDKGSGIAMICTFGDTTDVTWWRELQLPTRAVIGFDGRFLTEPPEGVSSDAARAAYATLAGATVHTGQQRMVQMLRESGDLDGEPKVITHPVKFYERGERPLEIVSTRQWYLRNGGRDLPLRTQLLNRGRELAWHPEFMRTRYQNWVEGLNGDWLVSRQRFFGVPFPLWYRLDADGNPLWDAPILADEAKLPVDPSSDLPTGFDASQRGQAGGFMGDPDVMDTWATSSLSPQIVSGWSRDEDLFARVFPMDLRPQAHDIIRTWLFSTVVRSHLEFDSLPWSDTAISGWILDPDRKKMSKSKGNVVTPMEILDQYGSDAFHYWAASARLGTDAAFDAGQLKIGRRLAMKLLNASNFVLGLGATETSGPVTEPIDRAMLAGLASVVAEATAAFDGYQHQRALEVTETFFWAFCDDYLELVKERAYGGRGLAAAASAQTALASALAVLLRLFAPLLPFVTEEVWSWWQSGSIHRAAWPSAGDVRELAGDGDALALQATSVALSGVRKAKSDAKLSMRTDIAAAVVRGPQRLVDLVESAAPDLRAAGRVRELTFAAGDGDDLVVDVTL